MSGDVPRPEPSATRPQMTNVLSSSSSPSSLVVPPLPIPSGTLTSTLSGMQQQGKGRGGGGAGAKKGRPHHPQPIPCVDTASATEVINAMRQRLLLSEARNLKSKLSKQHAEDDGGEDGGGHHSLFYLTTSKDIAAKHVEETVTESSPYKKEGLHNGADVSRRDKSPPAKRNQRREGAGHADVTDSHEVGPQPLAQCSEDDPYNSYHYLHSSLDVYRQVNRLMKQQLSGLSLSRAFNQSLTYASSGGGGDHLLSTAELGKIAHAGRKSRRRGRSGVGGGGGAPLGAPPQQYGKKMTAKQLATVPTLSLEGHETVPLHQLAPQPTSSNQPRNNTADEESNLHGDVFVDVITDDGGTVVVAPSVTAIKEGEEYKQQQRKGKKLGDYSHVLSKVDSFSSTSKKKRSTSKLDDGNDAKQPRRMKSLVQVRPKKKDIVELGGAVPVSSSNIVIAGLIESPTSVQPLPLSPPAPSQPNNRKPHLGPKQQVAPSRLTISLPDLRQAKGTSPPPDARGQLQLEEEETRRDADDATTGAGMSQLAAFETSRLKQRADRDQRVRDRKLRKQSHHHHVPAEGEDAALMSPLPHDAEEAHAGVAEHGGQDTGESLQGSPVTERLPPLVQVSKTKIRHHPQVGAGDGGPSSLRRKSSTVLPTAVGPSGLEMPPLVTTTTSSPSLEHSTVLAHQRAAKRALKKQNTTAAGAAGVRRKLYMLPPEEALHQRLKDMEEGGEEVHSDEYSGESSGREERYHHARQQEEKKGSKYAMPAKRKLRRVGGQAPAAGGKPDGGGGGGLVEDEEGFVAIDLMELDDNFDDGRQREFSDDSSMDGGGEPLSPLSGLEGDVMVEMADDVFPMAPASASSVSSGTRGKEDDDIVGDDDVVVVMEEDQEGVTAAEEGTELLPRLTSFRPRKSSALLIEDASPMQLHPDGPEFVPTPRDVSAAEDAAEDAQKKGVQQPLVATIPDDVGKEESGTPRVTFTPEVERSPPRGSPTTRLSPCSDVGGSEGESPTTAGTPHLGPQKVVSSREVMKRWSSLRDDRDANERNIFGEEIAQLHPTIVESDDDDEIAVVTAEQLSARTPKSGRMRRGDSLRKKKSLVVEPQNTRDAVNSARRERDLYFVRRVDSIRKLEMEDAARHQHSDHDEEEEDTAAAAATTPPEQPSPRGPDEGEGEGKGEVPEGGDAQEGGGDAEGMETGSTGTSSPVGVKAAGRAASEALNFLTLRSSGKKRLATLHPKPNDFSDRTDLRTAPEVYQYYTSSYSLMRKEEREYLSLSRDILKSNQRKEQGVTGFIDGLPADDPTALSMPDLAPLLDVETAGNVAVVISLSYGDDPSKASADEYVLGLGDEASQTKERIMGNRPRNPDAKAFAQTLRQQGFFVLEVDDIPAPPPLGGEHDDDEAEKMLPTRALVYSLVRSALANVTDSGVCLIYIRGRGGFGILDGSDDPCHYILASDSDMHRITSHNVIVLEHLACMNRVNTTSNYPMSTTASKAWGGAGGAIGSSDRSIADVLMKPQQQRRYPLIICEVDCPRAPIHGTIQKMDCSYGLVCHEDSPLGGDLVVRYASKAIASSGKFINEATTDVTAAARLLHDGSRNLLTYYLVKAFSSHVLRSETDTNDARTTAKKVADILSEVPLGELLPPTVCATDAMTVNKLCSYVADKLKTDRRSNIFAQTEDAIRKSDFKSRDAFNTVVTNAEGPSGVQQRLTRIARITADCCRGRPKKDVLLLKHRGSYEQMKLVLDPLCWNMTRLIRVRQVQEQRDVHAEQQHVQFPLRVKLEVLINVGFDRTVQSRLQAIKDIQDYLAAFLVRHSVAEEEADHLEIDDAVSKENEKIVASLDDTVSSLGGTINSITSQSHSDLRVNRTRSNLRRLKKKAERREHRMANLPTVSYFNPTGYYIALIDADVFASYTMSHSSFHDDFRRICGCDTSPSLCGDITTTLLNSDAAVVVDLHKYTRRVEADWKLRATLSDATQLQDTVTEHVNTPQEVEATRKQLEFNYYDVNDMKLKNKLSILQFQERVTLQLQVASLHAYGKLVKLLRLGRAHDRHQQSLYNNPTDSTLKNLPAALSNAKHDSKVHHPFRLIDIQLLESSARRNASALKIQSWVRMLWARRPYLLLTHKFYRPCCAFARELLEEFMMLLWGTRAAGSVPLTSFTGPDYKIPQAEATTAPTPTTDGKEEEGEATTSASVVQAAGDATDQSLTCGLQYLADQGGLHAVRCEEAGVRVAIEVFEVDEFKELRVHVARAWRREEERIRHGLELDLQRQYFFMMENLERMWLVTVVFNPTTFYRFIKLKGRVEIDEMLKRRRLEAQEVATRSAIRQERSTTRPLQ